MPLEAGAAETRVEDALGAEGGVADAVEEAEDEALPEGLALAVEDGVAGLVAEGSEAGAAEEAEAESGVSAWETRFGMRVDALAAFAYIFGPLSGATTFMLHIRGSQAKLPRA